MKERERRERLARGEPEPVERAPLESHNESLGAERHSSHEYPFGSDAASQQSELDAIRAEMMAAANQRSASGNSMFDSISNSHGGPAAEGQAPPGLPGRSSRFARFFDGRGAPPRDPQAAALAAQQKMLESMGAQPAPPASEDKESSNVHSPKTPQNASSSSINISELFSKSSIRDTADATGKDASGKNVSDADQQSMQKLMAMLQGGGGAASGTGTPTSNKEHANEHAHHHQRADADDRLKELLGGGGQARHADHLGDRPRSIVSPGLSSAEAHGHAMEARSPLPYPQQQQQQHQRESSTSSGGVGHGQHLGPQHQHQHQQPHESQQQFPQYQQQLQQQQRSDSPAMGGGNAYNDPRQQLSSVGSPTSPGAPGVGSPGAAPGMGGFGGFPGAMAGRPPPPGMDPRMMARPPMGAPGFQQLPPHLAASLGLARGPMPPGMGSMPPPPPMGRARTARTQRWLPRVRAVPGRTSAAARNATAAVPAADEHAAAHPAAGAGGTGIPARHAATAGIAIRPPVRPSAGPSRPRSSPYYAQGPGGMQPPASPQQHQPVRRGRTRHQWRQPHGAA
ncbi:hypothetical protein L1887_53696 [Cichorium endivia]|nr:hypothetical protein L1887_53696 [Cichorium endivia]